MRIDVLSIFPAMFEPVLASSMVGRARKAGLVQVESHDIRSYTKNKQFKTDDRVFGGGPGMVMMCQPLWDAVLAVEAMDARPATRILMTPQGQPLRQSIVEEFSTLPRLLLIAGHYEGIDERVIERLSPREISIGDYVLTGGELPAMVLIDAVARLQPGVLGHEASAAEDSFGPDALDPQKRRLLDCPHYTRPRAWEGMEVPEVLVGGDHQAVARWRLEQRIKRTTQRRPDLLEDTGPAQS